MQTPNQNFVNHVPKPKWSINLSWNSQWPKQLTMANESTGTYGALLWYRALTATFMSQQELMMLQEKLSSTSKRRVKLTSPIPRRSLHMHPNQKCHKGSTQWQRRRIYVKRNSQTSRWQRHNPWTHRSQLSTPKWHSWTKHAYTCHLHSLYHTFATMSWITKHENNAR